LTADCYFVVYRWHCIGTHTRPAYHDFDIGPLSAASGAVIELAGRTAVRCEGELIAEEAVLVAAAQGADACRYGQTHNITAKPYTEAAAIA
jgi:hypothetical protein